MRARTETENEAAATQASKSGVTMEDIQAIDPTAMQLQMLFMANQMAMMTRELERLQTKVSPDIISGSGVR